MARGPMWMLALCVACRATPTADVPPSSAPPVTSSALRLVDVDTEGLRRAVWDRGPRVSNVWATWCGPCVAEIPVLLEAARSHPAVELVFVNVDGVAAPVPKITRFVEEHGMASHRHLRLAEADPVAALVEAIPGWDDTVPYTVIVDPAGSEHARFSGAVDAERLAAALGGLAGRPE